MGHQMELFQVASGSWRYGCLECATSYKAIKRRQYGWISPMKSTKARAKEAAMKIYEQMTIRKLLTKEEIIDSIYLIPCVIEERKYGIIYADLLNYNNSKEKYFGMYAALTRTATACPMYDIREYGKTWRCWASRPTNEERDAAKWEVNAYEESRNDQEHGQAPRDTGGS